MAVPLKQSSGEIVEFSTTDQIPAANLTSIIVPQTATLTTTDATATNLYTPTTASGSAYGYDGMVLARNTATGDTALWRCTWALKNVGAGGVLVGSMSITAIAADAGASTWLCAQNGARIRVTGQAATTIHWSFDGRQITLT
jgi:hypothetical protein